MKKSLVIAGMIFSATILNAMNIDYFVALGAGQGYETIEVKVANVTVETKDDGGVLSVGAGVIVDDSHRVSLEYTQYSTSGDSSMYSIGLGYDYRITLKDMPIKPFIGLSYVLVKYSEDLNDDATVTWDKSSADVDTNVLMARIGVDYEINESFYASLLYDISLTTSGTTDVGVNINGTNYVSSVEVTDLSKLELLVGYKF